MGLYLVRRLSVPNFFSVSSASVLGGFLFENKGFVCYTVNLLLRTELQINKKTFELVFEK